MKLEKLFSIENAHTNNISSLEFNPVSNILASSSKDSFVKLWKVNNEDDYKVNEELEYKFHLNEINHLKWNPDGILLASGGNDCSINVMDVEKTKLNRNFRTESIITCLDFNYSSNLILCGTFDNQINLWDMRSKNVVYTILAHSEPITSVSFSKDSTVFITSSYDGFCRIWDIFKGNCLKTIVLEKSPPINSSQFMSDNNFLLISSLNNQIQVMDIIKEEELTKFTGHINSRFLIDISTYYSKEDDKVYILAGSEDGHLYYWNVEDDDLCFKYKINNGVDNINVNCISHNNKDIFVCSGFPDNKNAINFIKINHK